MKEETRLKITMAQTRTRIEARRGPQIDKAVMTTKT